MKEVIVTDVGYSSTKKYVTIKYEMSPDNIAIAVTAKCLCPKVGDKVWVLKNDELNYKGFNAVAVLIA